MTGSFFLLFSPGTLLCFEWTKLKYVCYDQNWAILDRSCPFFSSVILWSSQWNWTKSLVDEIHIHPTHFTSTQSQDFSKQKTSHSQHKCHQKPASTQEYKLSCTVPSLFLNSCSAILCHPSDLKLIFRNRGAFSFFLPSVEIFLLKPTGRFWLDIFFF